MPTVKQVNNKRTIVEYTLDEFKILLGLDEVLSVYILNGKVEIVTASDS